MFTDRTASAVIGGLLAALALAPAAAVAAPGDNTLMSKPAGDSRNMGVYSGGEVSRDGRRAVWESLRTSGSHVYVRDRVEGRTIHVAGDAGQASRAHLSDDGLWVSFCSDSDAYDMHDDRNEEPDVFIASVQHGGIDRVSIATDGSEGHSGACESSISGDGRYVAFLSESSNLAPGGCSGTQTYVRDRVARTTTLVSRASGANGACANGSQDGGGVSISGDGRTIAFVSKATNLDGNSAGRWQAFVRDLDTNTTRLVSRMSSGAEAPEGLTPDVSHDGRYVAFSTGGLNYTPNDGRTVLVAVHDTVTGTTQELHPGHAAVAPSISADGSRISYTSHDVGSNTVSLQGYVWDRPSNAVELISRQPGADGAPAGTWYPTHMAADGGFATFVSHDYTLYREGERGEDDTGLWLRELGAGTAAGGGGGTGTDGTTGGDDGTTGGDGGSGGGGDGTHDTTNTTRDETDDGGTTSTTTTTSSTTTSTTTTSTSTGEGGAAAPRPTSTSSPLRFSFPRGRRSARDGRIAVRVVSTAKVRLRATLTLFRAGKRIGRASFTIGAGRTITVRVRVARSARGKRIARARLSFAR